MGSRQRRRWSRSGGGSRAPVHTHDGWDRPPLGFLEIDLVAPGSGSLGWLRHPGHRSLDRLEGELAGRGPVGGSTGSQWPIFPIRGIDSDNSSAFINETLIRCCAEREIEFTRSRAYVKNDLGVGRAEEGRCGAPPCGASPERPTFTGRCGSK